MTAWAHRPPCAPQRLALCTHVLAALLLGASGAAAAATPEPAAPAVNPSGLVTPAPSGSAPPSSAPSPAATRAREHHARAVERYDAADYPAALDEFRQAYALLPSYQLLFNIGQIEYRLQRYAEAHRSLERYLNDGARQVPPERRERVLAQLTELARRTGRVLVPTPLPGLRVAAPIPRPPRAAPHPLATPAWITTGALGLAAVGCGVATLLTSRHHDELRARPAEPGEAERKRDALDQQRRLVSGLATTTDVLAVATLASAAFGLYFTLTGGSTDESEQQLSLHLSGDGVFATWSF